jgi:hypothetical protein
VNLIVPLDGSKRAQSKEIKVVFPAPFGPNNPTFSPLKTQKLMLFSEFTLDLGYFFNKLVISIITDLFGASIT